jgi:hypothetical protein
MNLGNDEPPTRQVLQAERVGGSVETSVKKSLTESSTAPSDLPAAATPRDAMRLFPVVFAHASDGHIEGAGPTPAAALAVAERNIRFDLFETYWLQKDAAAAERDIGRPVDDCIRGRVEDLETRTVYVEARDAGEARTYFERWVAHEIDHDCDPFVSPAISRALGLEDHSEANIEAAYRRWLAHLEYVRTARERDAERARGNLDAEARRRERMARVARERDDQARRLDELPELRRRLAHDIEWATGHGMTWNDVLRVAVEAVELDPTHVVALAVHASVTP